MPETEALWYLEPREDVAETLRRRGWTVSAVSAADLMAHYQRPAAAGAEETAPASSFVTAGKPG